MMNHLLDDHGAFHNRIRKRIQLMPFSLRECEKLLSGNGIILPKTEMIECYMAFGGIPYYLDRMDERLSLIQNMDELCFKPYGDLYNEYDNLIRSLFRKPEKHLAILETLSDAEMGLSRKSLSEIKAIGGGSVLTKDLQELEQNGFIHAYPLYPDRNEVLYQLADPFSLFALRALRKMEYASFSQFYRSPAYSVWRKNAFFRTCLHHVPQIKAALGISGVETHEAAWQCFEMGAMAQANLVIDRPDGIIHLCELKSTDEPFEMTREAYEQLQQRVSIFLQKVKPCKAVHVAIISANGLKPGKYVSIAQNLIDGDALFAR
ncbi:MAG: hypothetical protein IJT77_02765 [Clostridia bacterium]|nr:hypothetical protein [Clostridia bacterium]